MKILLLTTHLRTGGVGIYTVNLAKYLKKRGIAVTVVSGGGPLTGILAKENVPHIEMNIDTKSEFGPKVWKAAAPLAKLITDGGFQVVHAQTRVAQVLAALAEKITHVSYISTCHGFFKHRRLSRRLFPCWGERTIAISGGVRDHLIKDFHLDPEKVDLVRNGIELERYGERARDNALLQKLGLGEDPIVVGTVGRLSSVKGLNYLLDAFKNIASRHDNVRLLIVGEGPENTPLAEQARELDIENKVFIVPGTEEPVEKYMYLFDVFCLTSTHEGLGLSLMEAMAAERACVASNVGGIPDLITSEENGILVPPRDVPALCGAITRLIENAGLSRTLSANARKKAMREFSIEDSVDGTIKVYEKVMSNGS